MQVVALPVEELERLALAHRVVCSCLLGDLEEMCSV
jgi:hypothetical protein